MKRKKRSGTLILEKIDFEDSFPRRVGKNNKTSGKVTLPPRLIGKEVIVILPKDKG